METIPCAVCGSRDVASTVSSPNDEFLPLLGNAIAKSSWVVCKGCGLVFQCPRITAADEQRLYAGREYYSVGDLITERYIANRLAKPPRILSWLREHKVGDGVKSPRMLDVGCGMGGALSVFRDAGWETTGVEPDPGMAEFGRERFGVAITVGYFGEGMLTAGSVDLVYTNHSYEHFRDPRAITEAIAAALKPGGHLFVAVPTYRQAGDVLAWHWMNVAHTYLYTHVSLGNLVGGFGLEPVAWRYPPEGGEVWFLARKTGRVRAGLTEREHWRSVRRTLLVHPLRHLIARPRGWPSVAQCYVQHFAGPRAAAAATRLARRLRGRRPTTVTPS